MKFPVKLNEDYPCQGHDADGRYVVFDDLLRPGERVGQSGEHEGDTFPPYGRVVERDGGLFCNPGSRVLDPFAGTGTTLRAALDAGCSSVGIEQNPAYIALTRERMAQGILEAA